MIVAGVAVLGGVFGFHLHVQLHFAQRSFQMHVKVPALFERLLHHAVVIQIEGASYRLVAILDAIRVTRRGP